MHSPADLEIAVALPPPGCSVAEAEHYTRWLAMHHYENFHVVSWFLPRRLRQHFYNVYAYCRWADDLADEVGSSSRALELLDWWGQELELCYANRPSHPVFVALAPTVRAFDIPAQPSRDLLAAFRQDQIVHRYATWDELLAYCRYSANPVGRLVLYLCGYRDTQRQRLADATCTALQLANFWQDVSRDLDNGRIYIPADALDRHGLSTEDIEARRFDARYVSLMKDLIARTRALFAQGLPLAGMVDAALRVDLDLFSRGGLAILGAIESAGYNTLAHRPAIGSATRARLLGRALFSRITRLWPRGEKTNATPSRPPSHVPSASQGSPTVRISYEECGRITRAARSNFYLSFANLRREKRNALYALYAFMRFVDDVSDEAGSLERKRAGLAEWRARLDAAVAHETTSHPILPALADTIERFQIPPRYLHDLISGAEMDLTVSSYPTYDRLTEYCYRVAGTVGLTCLYVFGFQDPHAPELAERLGVAFQLTNIVRDVSADYRIGRIYLPSEDLVRFGCREEDLRGPITPQLAELLAFQAERAWALYGEGARLIQLIAPESRAMLWTLIRTYSMLLARIEERGFDVFSSRVGLSSAEKVHIMLIAGMSGWWKKDAIAKRNRDRRRSGGAFLGRRAG